MVGFAVALRCPYCRMPAGQIGVEPGVTVMFSAYCKGRNCRKERREEVVYMVRDGRARALTGEERSRIVEQAGRPAHNRI